MRGVAWLLVFIVVLTVIAPAIVIAAVFMEGAARIVLIAAAAVLVIATGWPAQRELRRTGSEGSRALRMASGAVSALVLVGIAAALVTSGCLMWNLLA